MPKFDKGFSEKLDQIGKAPATDRRRTGAASPTTRESVAVQYRKVTFHNRSDLQDRLQQALDKLAYEKQVRLSQAVLIRYALNAMLDRLDQDPDALLADLAQFEQAEIAISNERYPVNKGLREYVQR